MIVTIWFHRIFIPQPKLKHIYFHKFHTSRAGVNQILHHTLIKLLYFECWAILNIFKAFIITYFLICELVKRSSKMSLKGLGGDFHIMLQCPFLDPISVHKKFLRGFSQTWNFLLYLWAMYFYFKIKSNMLLSISDLKK